MPCDTIQTSQVHLGLANTEILGRTLEGLADKGSVRRYGRRGFAFTKDGERYLINDNGDLISTEGNEGMGDVVKRAYSREVIRTGAKKFGWSLDIKNPSKLAIRRKF